uniref:Peptidase S1 domain-containing protein n=1 Tax=Anopheles culicifacies TaxID=139723 RepID=A0A182M926_9DIPT
MNCIRCYGIALIQLYLLLLVDSRLTQSCGKRKVVNLLIVNGTHAKDGYWPWHAALFHNDGRSFVYKCGGTILDENTVITTAHCLMTSHGIIARERLVVQVGRHRLRTASDHAQEREAFQLILHPENNVNSIQHDIALIKLATDFTYTDYVQPICLWNRGKRQHTIVGSFGTVVGFGLDENDNPTDTLREARIPVVSAITCVESNREVFGTQLTSNMFCAGNRDGVGACNGDSGGGMFFNYDGTWYIRGLVSFTKPREDAHVCDTKEYTVFTDVAKYLKWIKQQMRRPVGQQNVTGNHNNPKIGLLPMSTCGPNPYEDRDELSKPVFLGYPWVGLMECAKTASEEKEPVCQATLISDRYLIATARCADIISNCHRSSIRLGDYDRNTTTDCAQVDGQMVCSPPVQSLEIESLIWHQHHNRRSGSNDIALIRLRNHADTSRNNIKPICLPVTNELRKQKSTHYTLTGWHYDLVSGMASNVPQRSLRELVELNLCKSLYRKYELNLTAGHICIKQQYGPNCTIPLVGASLQLVQGVQKQSRYVLYGMFSDGTDNCESPFPDAYVNIVSYVDWILENIQE